ncbi:MAG: hypothetical protein U9R44_03890, partial [Candidatus Omnitrophota bacterium]|nr:hypothetical protein [Candidatus Omnitrophota bacterium]
FRLFTKKEKRSKKERKATTTGSLTKEDILTLVETGHFNFGLTLRPQFVDTMYYICYKKYSDILYVEHFYSCPLKRGE